MPMYEYRCEKCEAVIEEMQKFSDAPLTDCTACGATGTLSKLISKSSFALKGTGWYTTDYKKSSAPTAAAPSVSVPATPAPAATPAAAPSPSISSKAD